jgi:RNA polymerase sigma-70 factor (ECF subfamily)
MAEQRIDSLSDNVQSWIAAAQRGDAVAFGCLVELYQRDVYNLAYRMLGDGAQAEEAAQEAFMRAYTRLRTYQPERSFKTWLLSIAAHYCIDLLRRRRITWLSIEQEKAPPEALASDRPGPEDSLIRSEREQAIQRMLADLAPDYRLSIVLRYWYDMSYEEIAGITSSTVSAVKSRLFRARSMLADQMTRAQAGALAPLWQEA